MPPEIAEGRGNATAADRTPPNEAEPRRAEPSSREPRPSFTEPRRTQPSPAEPSQTQPHGAEPDSRSNGEAAAGRAASLHWGRVREPPPEAAASPPTQSEVAVARRPERVRLLTSTMSVVPQDYDFNVDKDEYPLFDRFKRPRLSTEYEIVKVDAVEGAGSEQPSGMGLEPESPQEEEEEEEDGQEQESASWKDVRPTRASEGETRGEREDHLPSPAKSGSPQVPKSEIPTQRYREQSESQRYENDTYENEMYEETYIDPLAEVDLEIPEYEFTESPINMNTPEATVGDSPLQSPKELKREVPEKQYEDIGLESQLESPEEMKQKVPEKLYEDIGLKPISEQITPDFPNEKLRKSVEEKIEPPRITEKEIREETRKDSTEKKSIEIYEQTKPHQRPRKSTEEAEEAGLEFLEETKSKVPNPKPGDLTEEKVPESLEEIKPELSGEQSRKSSLEPSKVPKTKRKKSHKEKITEPPEEASVEMPQEMEPDAQIQRQRKSLEDTKQTDQKEKQKKLSEQTGQATPEKSKLEETLKESTEQKGQERPEQTKSKFPKEDSRKSTDETDQVPPHMGEPEVQGETQVDKNLKLSGETKTREKHTEFPKDISLKQIKSDSSVDRDEYQMRKLSRKGTDITKKNQAFSSSKDSEVGSVSMDDSDSSPELQKLLSLINTEYLELYHSESQDNESSSSSESNPPQEKEDLISKHYQFQQIKDFDYLAWSPETVADWISYLGFPQYKECFTTNFISGRKLIHVNCSNLPQIGISDFEDMQIISHHVRELLKIEEPLFSRSIRLPYRDNIGLFLERKSHSGVTSESLTLSEFVKTAGLQDCDPQTTAPEEKKALLK
ncbi:sterile alpha motif domain-containing protein 15 [Thomomys bottae]